MNKKDIIHKIAEDYADAMFEQFERTIVDVIEIGAPDDALDVVNKYLDCDRYDTYAISRELLNIEVQDIWESIKDDFEIKYLKKINERVRCKLMDMTLMDYLSE